jgi:hypothetical protein
MTSFAEGTEGTENINHGGTKGTEGLFRQNLISVTSASPWLVFSAISVPSVI